MKRLLVAINEGELIWTDLQGAVISKVRETVEGDKYITDLIVTVNDKDYIWTITGKIENVTGGT